jgi:thiol-disulfide isomerase/thioredoxin
MNSKEFKLVVGKIYAPWCGHCQALESEWKKMEKKVGGNVEVVNISSEENQDDHIEEVNKNYIKSGEKLKLQGGYPTIFKIKNGVVEYYNGNRTSSDLINWVSGSKKQQGGKSKKNRKSKKIKKLRKTRRNKKIESKKI